MKVGGTLFWFNDENKSFNEIDNYYFSLGNLLNRLLNKFYEGKRLQFVNIEFCTSAAFDADEYIYKDFTYYYGGHLKCYVEWDVNEFQSLDIPSQKAFIWEEARRILVKAGKAHKNPALELAANKAYKMGLSEGLNPDYRVIRDEVVIHNKTYSACIWITFGEEYMYSKFTLESEGKILYERPIDEALHGIEFFLVIYKRIIVSGDNIVIKGARDVEYLPLSIPIAELGL